VGVLQGAFLGEAAMGFRAQTGTLHVAQLLTDLIGSAGGGMSCG